MGLQDLIMSDADPMEVYPGDQLAASPKGLLNIILAKGHPVTATKQLRNLGRVIESSVTRNMQLPPVPLYKLTPEDIAKFPSLKDVTHVQVNGNNRQGLYERAGVPMFSRMMERNPSSNAMIDAAVNSADLALGYESPFQQGILDMLKVEPNVVMKSQDELADFYEPWAKKNFPEAVSELIGERPFINVPSQGGWMGEMTNPSGNMEIPWTPWKDWIKTLKEEGKYTGRPYADLSEVASTNLDPAKRWMANELLKKKEFYGMENLDASNKIFKWASGSHETVPSYLNQQFIEQLPFEDLPMDAGRAYIRSFPNAEERKFSLEAEAEIRKKLGL
jgi:hypothetical protein